MHLFLLAIQPKYQRLRLWSAFLLYAAVIVLGALPGARAEVGIILPGFILHFAAYAGISFLLFSGFDKSPKGRALKAFVIVTLMGAGDELIQTFLPYRHGTVSDWLIDVFAGFFTSGLLLMLSSKLPLLKVTWSRD